MRSGLRKKLDTVYRWIENNYRAYARRKEIRIILNQMGGGNTVYDDKYSNEYLGYWRKYGKKPNKMWLRIYAKKEEGFTPRYIPDDQWFGEILPYFSNMDFRRPYEDKCFHEKIFTMLNRPETVVKCMAGLYFDSEGNELTKSQAMDLILNSRQSIIKPSIDSGMGRLIQFFDEIEDNKYTLERKLEFVGQNFIVQKILNQHKDMKAINPKSLNTIRLLTFYFEGEIHLLSVIARMGSGDAKIDNVSAGGLQITVNKEDGTFYPYAMDKKRNLFKAHPDTGFVFEGFKIPSFEKVVEHAKRGARILPHFKIIGWDFAVGEDGEPVFIEYNVCPDQNQMTAGPTFGDLTEKVLEEVYLVKRFKDSQN